MPLVNVKLIEGVFTPAQKQEIVCKLTDTMVSIEGENLRPVTWVVVEEVKGGDWGVGGKGLTAKDAQRTQTFVLDADEPAILHSGDRGANPAEFGRQHARLPKMNVFGGCCGTDHRHVEAVFKACL
jgi:4-oxalocrotonate tautomerase